MPYRSYSEMSLALLKKMKVLHPKIVRSEQAIYLRLNSLKKKGSIFASNVSGLVTPKQYKTPRGIEGIAVETESPKASDNQFIGTKVAKVFGSGINGVLYSGSYNYKNIVFIYFYSFILLFLLVHYYYYY